MQVHWPTRSVNPPHRSSRGGFTLVELIVVITIILILVAITASAIRINYDSDRIRGGARQMQSYLLGARDRAIHAKAPRGVRLLLNPSILNSVGGAAMTVNSMVYIEPIQVEPYNVEIFGLNDKTAPINSSTNPALRVELPINPSTGFVRPVVPDWASLDEQGLLVKGRTRIKIPADSRGEWYVIQDYEFDPPTGANRGRNYQALRLTEEYRKPTNGIKAFTTAQIELPAAVLANEQPVQLPAGICVDLYRCRQIIPTGSNWKIPAAWRDASSPPKFQPFLDIMFSPRGAVIGPAAASGVIQLYLTEEFAAEANLDPAYTGADAYAVPDKIITTIFTRTGNVLTSPVNTTDVFNNSNGDPAPTGDGYADDPFYYSERGEVAGK